MTFARVVRTVFALALLAAPAWAEHATFEELRHAHPIVREAVAGLPDSGINGPLNRISALLARPAVHGLPAGSSAELPANFDRLLLRALEDLEDDLWQEIRFIPLRDRLVLLQVVDIVVFQRVTELYSDQPWESCWLMDECDNHPVIQALDRIATLFNVAIAEGVEQERTAPGGDPSLPAVEIGPDVNSQTLDGWISDLLDRYGRATGVESIDS